MILGVNLNHDYSLCILDNNKLYLKEMERFSRIKHHWNETSYTLAILDDLPLEKLKKVKTIYLNSPRIDKIRKRNGNLSSTKHNYFYHGDYLDINNGKLIAKGKIVIDDDIEINAKWISHYLAHAASGYYYSSFSVADIICLDGGGDIGYGAWFTGEKNKINLIEHFSEIEYALSYHFFAQNFFKKNNGFFESKLMAVASFGNKKFSNKTFFSKNGSLILDKNQTISVHDVAKFQFDFEKNIIKIIKSKQKHKKLICVGGAFLNISLNSKIVNSKIYSDVYIPPFPSDMGTSIGCALIASFDYYNKIPHQDELTPYLGDSIEIELEELKKLIEKFKDKVVLI